MQLLDFNWDNFWQIFPAISTGTPVTWWDSSSGVLVSIWSFITNLITSMVNMVAFISEGFSFFSIITQFLPGVLSLSVLTAIAIGVMKLLLGK